MYRQQQERGITLLITLLLMGVLLGVSASLLNITLKQYQLSGIALASEIAFQAANAGLECILYSDFISTGSPFTVPDDGTEQTSRPQVSCMGLPPTLANATLDDDNDGQMKSGEEQRFEFDWGTTNPVCSSVSIFKFSSASVDVPVVVDSVNRRKDVVDNTTGFAIPDGIPDPCPAGSVCTVVQARGYNVSCSEIDSSPRVVEREYTQVY